MGIFSSEGGGFPGIPGANIEEGFDNFLRALRGEKESREEERKRRDKEKGEAQQKHDTAMKLEIIKRTVQNIAKGQDPLNAAAGALSQPGTSPVDNLGQRGLADPALVAEIAGKAGDARIAAERQKELAGTGGGRLGSSPSSASTPAPTTAPRTSFVPAVSAPITQQLRDLVSFAASTRSSLDLLRSSGLQGGFNKSPLVDILRQRKRAFLA